VFVNWLLFVLVLRMSKPVVAVSNRSSTQILRLEKQSVLWIFQNSIYFGQHPKIGVLNKVKMN